MNETIGTTGIVLVGFFVFLIFAIYQTYKNRKLRKTLIHRNFGKLPERDYDLTEYENISHYFWQKGDMDHAIDDITWNDLDMDSVFRMMNHTWSAIGESSLYNLLRRPEFSEEKLDERERLIQYFSTHEKEREQFLELCAEIGKTGRYSVFDYIYNLADLEIKTPWKHYLNDVLMLGAVGLLFVQAQLGILAVIVMFSVSMGTYYGEKRKIEPYVSSCSCLLNMLKFCEKVEKLPIKELESYFSTLRESRKKFGNFKKKAYFFVAGSAVGGGLETIFIEYLNYVFHLDLIQFPQVIKELKDHMGAFEEMTETIGLLESMAAVASFRTMISDYTVPVLRHSTQGYLKIEDVYHPMLQKPVKNSITAERGILLTGSNASGKSTFLKTVAINAILAQTVHTCMAGKYEASFFRIYSSMALRDDLVGQESYYIVEIKSLKRILDAFGGEIPVLCFVDEVLRGTNTVERIAASSQILKSMARKDVICFAATHDVELTHLLEKEYDNYHFQEEVKENDITFNYLLYPGRATSRNAIKLLGIMGYDKTIIAHAEQAAQQFLETGEWHLSS
ncbi:MAG: hypothetical protein SO016_05345 [Lachnospiraceae bacterium]|nr:hypothetical protein [Robinsoniella sp.]MDY3766108.1 hypothetical protein [Lachnospiraceae bacterium]